MTRCPTYPIKYKKYQIISGNEMIYDCLAINTTGAWLDFYTYCSHNNLIIMETPIIKEILLKDKKDLDDPNDTLDKIQEVRAKNNVNWVDILKLAFKHSPEEAKKIMANIVAHDKQISALCEKLSK
jgi:hypothetical protein